MFFRSGRGVRNATEAQWVSLCFETHRHLYGTSDTPRLHFRAGPGESRPFLKTFIVLPVFPRSCPRPVKDCSALSFPFPIIQLMYLVTIVRLEIGRQYLSSVELSSCHIFLLNSPP